jgi:disulfide bond formation protein DsbB
MNRDNAVSISYRLAMGFIKPCNLCVKERGFFIGENPLSFTHRLQGGSPMKNLFSFTHRLQGKGVLHRGVKQMGFEANTHLQPVQKSRKLGSIYSLPHRA